MPLGIELAASWSRMISCAEILSQLQEGLDLLTTSLRDVPERHRSLRAIFDHSWGMLTHAEREIFAKVAVFRGGFTLAAANHVVGASLPLLASLLDKSLLRMEQEGRYELHELLRQYAVERLAESSHTEATIQDRHALYYAQHVQEAAQQGIGTPAFALAVGAEIDNIRRA